MLQLTSHLATPERVRALYVLSLALGELEPWERDRLDVLVSRVLGVLRVPSWRAPARAPLVEQRRAVALRLVGDARARSTASGRHRVRMCSPCPRRPRTPRRLARPAAAQGHCPRRRRSPRHRGTRASRSPRGPSRSARRGLRRAGGARSRRGRGRAPRPGPTARPWSRSACAAAGPASEALAAAADFEDAVAEALRRPPMTEPAADLEIEFDDEGSPWHTLCEVRGDDRHGLLEMITVGFAAAGVTVHSARIETRGRCRHRPLRAHRHRRAQARRGRRAHAIDRAATRSGTGVAAQSTPPTLR